MSCSAFTEYLKDLSEHDEPEPARFRAVWSALGRLLRREMRRRALWSAPPRYLGIVGGGSWAEPGVFDELLTDCYVYIFVQRLRPLRAQARVRDSIDGLIRLNVRHFLHDAQRRHDPLGYRVFELLHRAILGAFRDGALRRLGAERGRRLRNASLIASVGAPGGEPAAGPAAEVDPARVRAWAGSLLPTGVVGRGREREAVVEALRERVVALVDELGVVRFGDLVEPLKGETRGRWTTMMASSRGRAAVDDAGVVEVLCLVERRASHQAVEDRADFARLVTQVERALSQRPERERTRRYLETLWRWCHILAAETGPLDASDIPSMRHLSRLLGIPRDRLPALFTVLHREVECALRALGQTESASVYSRRSNAVVRSHDM